MRKVWDLLLGVGQAASFLLFVGVVLWILREFSSRPESLLVPSGVSVQEVKAALDAYRAEAEQCRWAVHACVELEDERMTRCLDGGP